MSRRAGALALGFAGLFASTMHAVTPVTRDLVIWFGNRVQVSGGPARSEIYFYCNGTKNLQCPNIGAHRVPSLGGNVNAFPPWVTAPLVDSNGHLIVVEENATGLPGTGDAAVVRRIEPDTPPAGLVANVALLGGFSQNPGPTTPTDAVLVHNRVLVIADAGPSSAVLGANVVDGQLLRVDLATGVAQVLPAGGNLVNPSALAADTDGGLWVADVRAGLSPPRPQLLRIDPVTGSQTTVASGASFGALGPAIDIALLPGGDILWLSQATGGFRLFEILRVDTTTGIGTKVAQFGSALAIPNGLASDAGSGLVLLAAEVNPAAIDPSTGNPFGSLGAFFSVDVATPFNVGSPAANLSTFATLGFLQSLPPLGVTIPPLAECNDGVPNFGFGAGVAADFEGVDLDGDGVDDPAPGCSGRYDVSERSDCRDGIDNDLDGLADVLPGVDLEEGCDLSADPAEEPDCADRIDNDGDGAVDFASGVIASMCTADPDCPFGQSCRNGFCAPATPVPADPGCLDFDAVEDPQCNDGLDNDFDGLVDWPADRVCTGPEEDSEALTACNDGVDNDGDGGVDFGGGLLGGLPAPPDADCRHSSDPNEASDQCSDGLDNDGDGLVDTGGGLAFAPCTVDADCQSVAICPGGGCVCADRLCVPGTPVGPDPECATGAFEALGPCTNGLDDDQDGLIDHKGVLLTAVCSVDADCDTPAIPECVFRATPTGGRAPCSCVGGFCKVGADPGCAPTGSGAIENPQCDDGLDNEDPGFADDLVDFAGLDHNGNGVVDIPSFNTPVDRFPDPGCRFPWSDDEAPECNDGLDNDGDGDVDLIDFFCYSPWDNSEALVGSRPVLGPLFLLCGLGSELVLILLPWWFVRRWVHGRAVRRAQASS